MRRPKESGQIRAKRVLDADVTTPMKRKRNGQIIPSEKCATEITCSIPSFQTVDEALQFSYESFPSMSFNPPLRPILVKSQIYAVVANRNYVDSQLMRMQNDGKIRMLKLEDETDETLAIMRSEDYAASFQDVNVLDIDDTTVFAASSCGYNVRLSGDPVTQATGQAGVKIVPCAYAAKALPIDSRPCAFGLQSTVKSPRDAYHKRCSFVVAVFVPTDCSPHPIKEDFYHQFTNLLHTPRCIGILVLARDRNALVGRFSTDEGDIGGPHSYDTRRSDNGERLLQPCDDNGPLLAGANFRHSRRQCATWLPTSATQVLTRQTTLKHNWHIHRMKCISAVLLLLLLF
ncbi:uncharacterized protein DEA37_0004813 [Paragonimus westermani]|uniref:Uncharacterized protein n=1 Tax=Paragonimus westermani TaxID=34504 RepID=A0A5J4NAM2_9TREM|nr:uncharacterized protein DEA37_0004813 [Paragonimus westermani]